MLHKIDFERIFRKLDFVTLKKYLHPHQTIQIRDIALDLDLKWDHEQDYYRWYIRGYINAATAFDTLLAKDYVKKDDFILDVGANIGFTAALFLDAGASFVDAVEPDPRNFHRLQAICTTKIRAHNIALGAVNGKIALQLSEKHNQGSTYDKETIENFQDIFKNSKSIEVELGTIDSLFSDKSYDLIKIDVEGAELDVLKGAEDFFKTNKPRTVIIESYKTIFPQVHQFLEKYYTYYARAIFNRTTHTIDYVEIDRPISDYPTLSQAIYYDNPPMYVYSLEPIQYLRDD